MRGRGDQNQPKDRYTWYARDREGLHAGNEVPSVHASVEGAKLAAPNEVRYNGYKGEESAYMLCCNSS